MGNPRAFDSKIQHGFPKLKALKVMNRNKKATSRNGSVVRNHNNVTHSTKPLNNLPLGIQGQFIRARSIRLVA
jgi:hypothetical protein